MLKSVQLPNGLEYIGKVSFSTSGIEEIVLPPSVKNVCVQAFVRCDSLRRV